MNNKLFKLVQQYTLITAMTFDAVCTVHHIAMC